MPLIQVPQMTQPWARPAVGPSPTPTPPAALRIVGTTFKLGDGVQAQTTLLECMIRTPFFLGGETTDMIASFANWYFAAAGGVINNSNTVTVVKAAIERDSGVTVPITFGGSRSITLASGDNDIQSDPLLPSAFGLSTFPADSKWWFRAILSIPAAGNFIRNVSGAVTGAKTTYYVPANRVDQVDGTGVISTPSGGTTPSSGPGPVTILGHFTSIRPSVIAPADSIVDGSNDFVNYVGGNGFFSRACVPPDLTNIIAHMKLSKVGSRALDHSTNDKERVYYKYGNIAYTNLGGNDIILDNATAAAIKSRMDTIYSRLRADGIQKIVRSRLIPNATSTDGYATEANQTPTTGYGTGQTSETVNNQSATDLTNAVVNAIDQRVVCFGTLPWVWPPNGTTDGAHPTTALHTSDAVNTRAVLLAQTVTS